MSQWPLLRGRQRLALALIILFTLGAPAAALRVFCIGKACNAPAQASERTPFCSLPDEVRGAVASGYREGRSGEILAVTAETSVAGSSASPHLYPLWPGLDGRPRVPVVVAGNGIRSGAELPPGTGLDDVAPTLSQVMRFDRPHPQVRSGKAVTQILQPGAPPRLVLVVAWVGVGSVDLGDHPEGWPNLRTLIREGAAGLDVQTGAASTDPAASLATLGTGGVPAQHGMTAWLVRNDEGALVKAWSRGSPVNVIATLGDDLDEELGQEPVVGLVGGAIGDLGLIGGRWYPGGDTDPTVIAPRATPESAASDGIRLLDREGFGRDATPDLLAVAMRGPIQKLDAALPSLLRAARDAAGGEVTVVVAGTGSALRGRSTLDATELREALARQVPRAAPLVEAFVPGGVFVNQKALARQELSDDVVLRALMRMRAPSGGALFADVFPGVAVTFGRYC